MNFKFNDFHFLLLIFLFFSLITSNHFLIFNEETVVAICFVSFMAFSFEFFGKSVKESLDERSITIKNEFHQALLLEQKYCQEIMYEHEAPIQKTGAFVMIAKEILSAKLQWYKHFRQQHLATFFEQSLRTLVDAKLNYRVRQMTTSRRIFEERWLTLMASEFEASVLAEFQTTNNEQFQEVLFAQSIEAVQKELSYKK